MGKWDFEIPTKSNNSFQLRGNTPQVKMTFDKVKEKRDIEFLLIIIIKAARRIVLSGLVWFFLFDGKREMFLQRSFLYRLYNHRVVAGGTNNNSATTHETQHSTT